MIRLILILTKRVWRGVLINSLLEMVVLCIKPLKTPNVRVAFRKDIAHRLQLSYTKIKNIFFIFGQWAHGTCSLQLLTSKVAEPPEKFG